MSKTKYCSIRNSCSDKRREMCKDDNINKEIKCEYEEKYGRCPFNINEEWNVS